MHEMNICEIIQKNVCMYVCTKFIYKNHTSLCLSILPVADDAPQAWPVNCLRAADFQSCPMCRKENGIHFLL